MPPEVKRVFGEFWISFPITSEHEDNGSESINYTMSEMQGKRKGVSISRSRFYRKNGNAHVGKRAPRTC